MPQNSSLDFCDPTKHTCADFFIHYLGSIGSKLTSCVAYMILPSPLPPDQASVDGEVQVRWARRGWGVGCSAALALPSVQLCSRVNQRAQRSEPAGIQPPTPCTPPHAPPRPTPQTLYGLLNGTYEPLHHWQDSSGQILFQAC